MGFVYQISDYLELIYVYFGTFYFLNFRKSDRTRKWVARVCVLLGTKQKIEQLILIG